MSLQLDLANILADETLRDTDARQYYPPACEGNDKRRGRALRPSPKRYQIQQMWEDHREIVRLLALGMSKVDIAKRLDVSTVTVSSVANSPLAQNHLAILQGARDLETVDVAAQIANLAPKAVEVLENLMDSQSASIRLSAAKDILDRAGHSPVRKVDTRVTTAHITPELLEEIKKRATQAAKENGVEFVEVVDAEVVEPN